MDKTMKLSTSGLGQQHGHEGAYLFFFFSCLLFHFPFVCFFLIFLKQCFSVLSSLEPYMHENVVDCFFSWRPVCLLSKINSSCFKKISLFNL